MKHKLASLAIVAVLPLFGCEDAPLTTVPSAVAPSFNTVVAAPLLFWNFENVTSSGSVSRSTASPSAAGITGLITQNCGGPAEHIGDWMFFTRYMGENGCYPWIDLTTATGVYLSSITFEHNHNHNSSMVATYPDYYAQLQLNTGAGWANVGAMVHLQNPAWGQVATVVLDRYLPAGTHRLRWVPRGLHGGWSTTRSEFFALDDVRLSGWVNHKPVAAAGGPYVIEEGGTITFDGSGSTDADGDALSFAWNLDGDAGFEVSGATATRTYADDFQRMIELRVTDAFGTTAVANATVTVTNVNPTISTLPGTTIMVGESYVAAGTFTDPGADTWTATVSYGPVLGVLPLDAMTFSLAHIFVEAGSFTVTVRVTDDDNGEGVATTEVVVLSPTEATASLETAIADLLSSGVLEAGVANALTSTLAAAASLFEKGNVKTATNQASAFINKVEAQIRTGRLDSVNGQQLIDYANRIIRSMKT